MRERCNRAKREASSGPLHACLVEAAGHSAGPGRERLVLAAGAQVGAFLCPCSHKWLQYVHMKTVGVRDLKNRLSEYLRRVRLGEGVLVTDRGEVVAELLPPGQAHGDPSVPAGLQALARRGLLTLGAPAGTNPYPALRRKQGGRRRSVAQLLDQERGTR